MFVVLEYEIPLCVTAGLDEGPDILKDCLP